VDETQAIAQLKRGNLEGLETLVKLHQGRALRTACLITRDLPQAEDVVQNAFLRAYEHIDQFDEGQPFAPWFNQIVIHDTLKVLQKQKKNLSIDEMEEENNFDIFDPAPLPEEVLESKETIHAVWMALARLEPRQRAAFVMRYYLQMPEKEIAETLQGPLGTIKWWSFSARRKLKLTLLADQSESAPGSDQSLKKEYRDE
jgi:RNA polymerase sigma-70 factor (ECF subfamily)